MFTLLWLKDTGERLLRTVLQAVIAAAIFAGPFNLTLVKSLVFVAITAALTVVKDALAAFMPAVSPASFSPTWSWFLDAFERLGATFVQAFVAALLTHGSYDLSTAKSAALAGVAAIASLLMSLLAQPFPKPAPGDPTPTPVSPASFLSVGAAPGPDAVPPPIPGRI